jgi:uncharacterized protein YndB with AHSA1/START domain
MKTRLQDKVEREVIIRAPKERIYAALTQPELFIKWWPKAIKGRIAVGETPVLDFGECGMCAFHIVAAEPHTYFAYRWAQGALPEEGELDPLTLPNTLVEFRLEDMKDGTRVRVTESGLASLPPERYDRSVPNIDEGWRQIIALLEKYFQQQ